MDHEPWSMVQDRITERNIMTKKTIKYNGREYKLPFNVQLPEDPTVQVEIKNRLGGESTTLPEFAAAVYDTIIGAEMFGDYDTVRKGLDWFRQHFAKQYMVLLD
jgi:hypothetical protein